MSASDQQTCEKGLAENSVLPAKVGELMSAMAGNLEAHGKGLDLTDPSSQAEEDVDHQLLETMRRNIGKFPLGTRCSSPVK